MDSETPFQARQRERLEGLKAKQDAAKPAASKKVKKKAKKKTGASTT